MKQPCPIEVMGLLSTATAVVAVHAGLHLLDGERQVQWREEIPGIGHTLPLNTLRLLKIGTVSVLFTPVSPVPLVSI